MKNEHITTREAVLCDAEGIAAVQALDCRLDWDLIRNAEKLWEMMKSWNTDIQLSIDHPDLCKVLVVCLVESGKIIGASLSKQYPRCRTVYSNPAYKKRVLRSVHRKGMQLCQVPPCSPRIEWQDSWLKGYGRCR